jgi:hypothetical protein
VSVVLSGTACLVCRQTQDVPRQCCGKCLDGRTEGAKLRVITLFVFVYFYFVDL